MKINNITLRPWQEEAVNRSLTPLNPDNSPNVGIFLEAAGGRGKTIGALAIAQKRGAKSVLILNNRRSILFGEEKKTLKRARSSQKAVGKEHSTSLISQTLNLSPTEPLVTV